MLKRMVAGLEGLGIPVAMTPDLSLQDAVKDLLAVAKLVGDEGADAFLRVTRLPEYDMPESDVTLASAWLRDRRGSIPAGILPQGVVAFRRLADDLKGLDAATPAWAVMTTWLFERSRYPARHLARHPCPEHWKALAVVHHLIRVDEEHAAQGHSDRARLVARVKRAGAINQDTAYMRASPAG